jgi:hypothetical protein
VALTGTDVEPIRSADLFGWAIKMEDEHGNTVRVLVSDEVLEDLASPPGNSIERLEEYRTTIERIASAKHAAGKRTRMEPFVSHRRMSADCCIT